MVVLIGFYKLSFSRKQEPAVNYGNKASVHQFPQNKNRQLITETKRLSIRTLLLVGRKPTDPLLSYPIYLYTRFSILSYLLVFL